MATGQLESDPKKFRAHLRDASGEATDRHGFQVNYEPVDYQADRDYLLRGVEDGQEGLQSTHDRAVEEGRKDSRGRFVYPMISEE